MAHPAHNPYFFWQARRSIVVTGIVVAILAVATSFIRPLEYSATSRFLIIERGSFAVDPYTAIRSSERIGDNLANIIFTSDFYDKVRSAGFPIAANVFPEEPRKLRKTWSKMVLTEVARGSGLLTVTVYQRNKDQAIEISRAIAAVLTTRSPEYIGGDVGVKLVDPPISSRFPVRPNLLENAITGFVLGLLLRMAYLYLQAHGEYRRGGIHGN